EGETPFRFDTLAYRARTDLFATLLLDPAPWLRVRQRGGYVFLDDRNPDAEGWAPLETTLTLLRNVDWVTLTVSNTYDLQDGDPPAHGDDLRVRLTVGTLQQDDLVPGLSLDYARDLDRGQVSAFGVEATARVGPVNLYALERLSLPSGRLSQSRLRAEWRGVVAAEARGLEWLPPAAVGLPTPEPYVRDLELTVEDAPQARAPTWRVAFSTRFDPALRAGEGGLRGSTLTARALLDSRVVGPARLSVDGFAEAAWQDDLQPVTYLRRANLEFGVELYERFGLQGTLGYAAS